LRRSAWSYYNAARLTIAFVRYFERRFDEGVDYRSEVWITWARLHAKGFDEAALHFMQTECPLIYYTAEDLYRSSKEDGSILECTEQWVQSFDEWNDETDLPAQYVLSASACCNVFQQEASPSSSSERRDSHDRRAPSQRDSFDESSEPEPSILGAQSSSFSSAETSQEANSEDSFRSDFSDDQHAKS